MATRFYFRSSGAPPMSPTPSTGWTSTASVARVVMSPTRALTTIVVRGSTSGAASPEFDLYVQLISEPLAAQLLTGTMTGVIRANENNGALNATLAHSLRVVSSDGTHLAHLTSGGTDVICASELTTTPPEIAVTGTSIARRFLDATDTATIPLTNYTCAAGDCLALELGCRDVDTGTTRSAEVVLQDNVGVDLDFDDVDTSGDPWMEMSMNVAFQAGGGGASHSRSMLMGVGSVLLPTGLLLAPAWWRYRRMRG